MFVNTWMRRYLPSEWHTSSWCAVALLNGHTITNHILYKACFILSRWFTLSLFAVDSNFSEKHQSLMLTWMASFAFGVWFQQLDDMWPYVVHCK